MKRRNNAPAPSSQRVGSAPGPADAGVPAGPVSARDFIIAAGLVASGGLLFAAGGDVTTIPGTLLAILSGLLFTAGAVAAGVVIARAARFTDLPRVVEYSRDDPEDAPPPQLPHNGYAFGGGPNRRAGVR